MKTELFVNSVNNHSEPPWINGLGWCKAITQDLKSYRTEGLGYLHLATKLNSSWTAFYRWDTNKGKFICTRYRDVLRKQKKAALLASLKQDLAIAQSSDPVSA